MTILQTKRGLRRFTLITTMAVPVLSQGPPPSAEKIVANSVQANQKDFQAAPSYNWKEREHGPDGSKTSQVTMIDGTPYYRVIAQNGKPLSSEAEAEERKKEDAGNCGESRRNGRAKT